MRNVLPSTADLVQRKIVLGLAAILISAGTARAESCPAPDPQIDAERCTGELFLDVRPGGWGARG